MTALVVESDDFASAALDLSLGGTVPVSIELGVLVATLRGCAGMAGGDPDGRSWAGGYDRAARAALAAMRQVQWGAERLAAMFAQTARNYAAAELASTAGPRASATPARVPMPEPVHVDVSVPSAAGASGGGPPGWFLVEAVVGRLCPNGHQDVLRTAADGWRGAARTLTELEHTLSVLPDVFAADRLPELDDVRMVCTAAAGRVGVLAGSARGLATSCDALASHVDEAHSAIEHALAELAGTSVLIEVWVRSRRW